MSAARRLHCEAAMHPGTTSSALLGLATLLAATPALAAANLRVELPTPAPALVYDEVDVDVIVANDGNKAASAVTLTIALPATHTSPQVHVMGELAGIDPRCALAGTALTCALGSLGKGKSTTVSFRIALPEAAEALTIAASASTPSPENTLADNLASVEPALLRYAVAIADGDVAHNRHCTGQGLTSFFECALFPSSISAHDVTFHGDGTLSFIDAPEGYAGVWSQDAAEHLAFTYFYGDEVVAEFVGHGVNPACFEGVVHFPGSPYVAPYEVCM